MLKPDRVIDCLGLYCPEPIFRTRMALDEMESGEILEILADDPAAEGDMKSLVKRLGHELISLDVEDDVIKIVIRKK
jgi:TusA-related sulfurtransferase